MGTQFSMQIPDVSQMTLTTKLMEILFEMGHEYCQCHYDQYYVPTINVDIRDSSSMT